MPSTVTDRLNNLTTSVAVKAPCAAVASSNITLAGLQTVGAVTVTAGDRVLVIGQTDDTENGIYEADTGDWARAKDFDGNRDAVQGTLVLVRNQFVEGAFYELTTANPVRIGTSSITFRLRDNPNVTFDLIQSEIDEGVTPTDFSYPPYHLLRYGGNGNNVAINNTAIANWKAVTDADDAEGLIPEGQFRINAQVEFPRKVECRGEITGAFNVLYQQRQNGWIRGLRCDRVFIRGLYFCLIESLYCNTAVFDGLNGGVGSFWNEWVACRIDEQLTVDISDSAGVNLNAWRGGRIGYLLFTGTGAGGHDNTWDGVDFTAAGNPNSGVLQNDSQMQVNHLRSCYFEAGATITGNFHIIGYQGDDVHMPPISRFAHILCSVGINPRLSRDFFSASPINAARGGNWDVLDSDGKPPSLSQALGGSIAVATDTTEPCGIGLRYEGTFSAAFSRFIINVSATGSDKFGLLVYYKSTAAFETISSNDGSSDTSYTPEPVALANDWKMLRISGPASVTGTTVVSFFAYGAVGGAGKFMAVGGFFANGERAVMAPSRPSTRVRFGSTTYDPPSLADGAGVTTTVNVAGAAAGDFVQVSFSDGLQGVTLTGWVSSTGVVSARYQNESGGVIDFASATLRAQVQAPYA